MGTSEDQTRASRLAAWSLGDFVCASQTDRAAMLAVARADTDAVLHMDADSGGQCLLTCPMLDVDADSTALILLLADLIEVTWGYGRLPSGGEPIDGLLYFSLLPPGAEVGGGMGGGFVAGGLWLHDELERLGLRGQIADVLSGRARRMLPRKAHKLNPREIQAERARLEDEWRNRPRTCPECGTTFVSVQNNGACPDCRHVFLASHPTNPQDYPR